MSSPSTPTPPTLSVSRTMYPHPLNPSSQPIYEYTLSNGWMSFTVITYGGIITSVLVPDKDGKQDHVVLGYPTLSAWLQGNRNFNSIVGRYANRIAKGAFVIDNKLFQLPTNNGPNHLHGGPGGLCTKIYNSRVVETTDSIGVELSYHSPDGEEGYPGNVNVTVTYSLTTYNAIIMSFGATTDAPTIINLCNHNYWNLAGHASGDILKHQLVINADHYTPVDGTLIPTGELAPVKGTALDFTSPQVIGSRIDAFAENKSVNGGYDHNFALNKQPTSNPSFIPSSQTHAATLQDPSSGRVMDVYTTAPGIQCYTGNFIDTWNGRNNAQYRKHAGVCLETQTFPDSPNKSHFPSPLLRPGQVYNHVVTHVFSVTK